MNTQKKFAIVGGSLFIVLATIFIAMPKKAAAYVIDQSQIANASFKFQDRTTITAHFPAYKNQPAQDVGFFDSNATDSTYQYKSTDPLWCPEKDNGGILFDKKKGAEDIYWNNPRALKQVKAYIDIDFSPSGTGTDCQNTSTNYKAPVTNAEGIYSYFQWNGANLDAAMDLPSANQQFTPNDADKNVLQSGSGCASYIKLSGDNSGTLFELTSAQRDNGRWGGPPRPDAHIYLASVFKKTGDCYVKAINFSSTISDFGILAGRHFFISDKRDTTGKTPPGSTEADSPSCRSNYGFDWLMCPALGVADGAAGAFNSFVEGQLCFKTGKTGGDSSTNGVVCSGKNNLTDQVKVAWGVIKNIATALLVIIMLILIISQAVGGGPVDAYTIRKVLPRLVAAVILIQLSWVLFKWTIDLSNDLGFAIRDLLFAPFGGSDSMHLDKLIGINGVNTATGGSTGANTTFALFAVLGGAGLAIANIPGLLVLALFVIMALLTAFLVLILRKILILMLVILAPLALIAWILPGTDRYWKLWKENFTKLLLMFPLIMALIAAGRIFAWITAGGTPNGTIFNPHLAIAHLGSLPVPYVASVSGFADLAIILIAFFGPYFMLPKAFSWGGSIMSAAARTATSMSDRVRNKAEKPVREYGERWQGSAAKKYDPNKGRLSRGFRRLQSGHYLPTERSRRLTIATGDKWASERNDEAAALDQRIYEKSLSGYDIYDMKDGKFGEFTRHKGAEYEDRNGKTVREGDLLDADGDKADKLTAVFKATDKKNAYKQRATGVEAGKQALIDVAGNSDKKWLGLKTDDAAIRASQAAHKLLLDTHSEIELQGSYVQGGKNVGKRATEVPTWDITLANSPPHYAAASNSRPDFAPDVKQSAEARASQALGRPVTYKDTPATDTATLKVLDKERLEVTLDRLTPEQVQSAHYGLYQDIERLGDAEIATKLAQKLEHFSKKGGQPGNIAVGSLRGGKEQFVNRALALAGKNLDDITA